MEPARQQQWPGPTPSQLTLALAAAPALIPTCSPSPCTSLLCPWPDFFQQIQLLLKLTQVCKETELEEIRCPSKATLTVTSGSGTQSPSSSGLNRPCLSSSPHCLTRSDTSYSRTLVTGHHPDKAGTVLCPSSLSFQPRPPQQLFSGPGQPLDLTPDFLGNTIKFLDYQGGSRNENGIFNRVWKDERRDGLGKYHLASRWAASPTGNSHGRR